MDEELKSSIKILIDLTDDLDLLRLIYSMLLK